MPDRRRIRSLVVSLVALAVAALAAPPAARAYPIPPRSLRLQVETSEVIVVAKVLASERVDAAKLDSARLGDAVATLAVEETLLAPAPLAKIIKVPYPAGLMCPAPPSYDEGSTVLAFLTQEKDGTFATVGLSYGTKNVSETDARSAYTARVRELVEIRSIRDLSRRSAETAEWVVRCAESPHTRAEAVMELNPRMDRAGETTPGLRDRLTPEQRERLVGIAVSSPTLLDGTLALVDALLPFEDPRLVARMRVEVERVSQAETVDEPWATIGLLEAYAGAIGWEQGAKLLEKAMEAELNVESPRSPEQRRRALDAYFEALAAR